MERIVEPLLEWYRRNKRDLPWRKDQNPYHVWISEIMLQQTRIEAVKEYYKRFIKRIPNIRALSQIDEDELLKLWEGLGYYSRARNLKKAAMTIEQEYGGIFPEEYDDIKKLSGIGEYTAGAISSICFDKKEVAIDGNVMRVYARVENEDIDVSDLKIKKKIGEKIKKILPSKPGDFNEGIMELGETICLPNAIPKCEICPLKELCKAHQNHCEIELPRKVKKKEQPEEFYTVFLLLYDGKIAIHKRSTGLLKNMWEFPNLDGLLTQNEALKWIGEDNIISSIQEGIENTHIFTHKKWKMKSYVVRLKKKKKEYTWVSFAELTKDYALPTAFMPFLKYAMQQKSE